MEISENGTSYVPDYKVQPPTPTDPLPSDIPHKEITERIAETQNVSDTIGKNINTTT